MLENLQSYDLVQSPGQCQEIRNVQPPQNKEIFPLTKTTGL